MSYMHDVTILNKFTYFIENSKCFETSCCLSYECKYDMNIYGTDIFRQNKTFLALFGYT